MFFFMVLVLVNYNNPGGVWGWFVYIYINAFSRRFYPKRLTVYSGYTFLISMCVPWDQLPADCHVNVPEYSSLLYSLSEWLAVVLPCFFPLQEPRLTWASVFTAVRAAVDTDTWTASARSLETAWTSSTSPPTPAWAACWRSACGTTTKVPIGSAMSSTSSNISQDKPVCVSLSGLSPAWLLQYVLVKDLQTGSRYFFLVEEWLSVDNEKTDGRVEIEVEASGKAPPPQR